MQQPDRKKGLSWKKQQLRARAQARKKAARERLESWKAEHHPSADGRAERSKEGSREGAADSRESAQTEVSAVIISCANCGKPVRLPIPIPAPEFSCRRCGQGAAVRVASKSPLVLLVLPHVPAAADGESQHSVGVTSSERKALAALGLAPSADPLVVKAAYRALVARYHPDKVAGLGASVVRAAHQRTLELNAAMQALEEFLVRQQVR